MASKSKRRRRVFRASCILAALIIAGSSFAWFTSKDEVTNRLTASSDYGVSIVESFTPPRNWLPGQEINKDVFAVNTGNIDAFVNLDVSGVLSYTKETLNATLDKTKGVKLNESAKTAIDGATTMEAGGTLAWTSVDPAADGYTAPGTVVSARETGATDDRWTPSASGVYIFRRSFDSNTDTYSYAGYYYDADTDEYYKIVLGNDVYPTTVTKVGGETVEVFDVSSNGLGAGVEIDENGIVTSGTPVVQYVWEEEVAARDVSLLFDGPNNRLIVSEAASTPNTSTDAGSNEYNASATAARAEIDYLNKKTVSDHAIHDYNQVNADYTYAKALAEARNKLFPYADAVKDADDTMGTDSGAQDTAYDNVVAGATTLQGNGDYTKLTAPTGANAIDVDTLLPENLRSAIAALTSPSASKDNVQSLRDQYAAMYTDANSLSQKIQDTLGDLATDKGYTEAEVAAKIRELKKQINDLKDALEEYEDTLANLKYNASTELTNIDVETATDAAKAKVEAIVTAATGALSAITGAGGLDSLAAAYTTATETSTSSTDTYNEKLAEWEAAVAEYNATVTRAKRDYDAAIAETQPDGVDLVDHGTNIVPRYSCDTTDADGTPTIGNAVADYVALDTAGTVNVPSNVAGNADEFTEIGGSSRKISAVKTAMDDAVGETNAAKNAYDSALQKIADDAEILIYVNLDPNYAENWTYDTRTDGTDVASFYLNKILPAGETSDQLITSVELADTVTSKAYKNLTFDLNVALDSAQVSYDDDQVTVLDDAVLAPAFGMNSNVQSDNTTVIWTTT